MALGRRQDDLQGEQKVLQAAAVLAVGATAVAFVAGLGTYLSSFHPAPPQAGG